MENLICYALKTGEKNMLDIVKLKRTNEDNISVYIYFKWDSIENVVNKTEM